MTKILSVSLWKSGAVLGAFLCPRFTIHVYRRTKLFAFASLPSIWPPSTPSFRFPYSVNPPGAAQIEQTKVHCNSLAKGLNFTSLAGTIFLSLSRDTRHFSRARKLQLCDCDTYLKVVRVGDGAYVVLELG